jgi:hypothetical protein
MPEILDQNPMTATAAATFDGSPTVPLAPPAPTGIIRSYDAVVENVLPGEKSVIARVGSTEIDRYGTVILPSGIDVSVYNQRNPIFLWEHGTSKIRETLPIGRGWAKYRHTEDDLITKCIFRADPFAQELFEFFKDGTLTGWSVRVLPHMERCGPPTYEEVRSRPELSSCSMMFRSSELLEVSAVAIAGNRDAESILVSRGLLLPDGSRTMTESDLASGGGLVHPEYVGGKGKGKRKGKSQVSLATTRSDDVGDGVGDIGGADDIDGSNIDSDDDDDDIPDELPDVPDDGTDGTDLGVIATVELVDSTDSIVPESVASEPIAEPVAPVTPAVPGEADRAIKITIESDRPADDFGQPSTTTGPGFGGTIEAPATPFPMIGDSVPAVSTSPAAPPGPAAILDESPAPTESIAVVDAAAPADGPALTPPTPRKRTIEKQGDGYVVKSKKGKVLGTYKSEAAAKKRLKQIEYFKHTRRTDGAGSRSDPVISSPPTPPPSATPLRSAPYIDSDGGHWHIRGVGGESLMRFDDAHIAQEMLYASVNGVPRYEDSHAETMAFINARLEGVESRTIAEWELALLGKV